MDEDCVRAQENLEVAIGIFEENKHVKDDKDDTKKQSMKSVEAKLSRTAMHRGRHGFSW